MRKLAPARGMRAQRDTGCKGDGNISLFRVVVRGILKFFCMRSLGGIPLGSVARSQKRNRQVQVTSLTKRIESN